MDKIKSNAGVGVSTSCSCDEKTFTVLLCYLYTTVDDPEGLKEWFEKTAASLNLTGRVLVANEGINANLASSEDGIAKLKELLEAHEILGGGKVDYKLDVVQQRPFPDLAVKLVKEIVATGGTMPFELLSEQNLGGAHLSPEEFHGVIDSHVNGKETGGKDLVVIDVRNRKEIEFGHFVNATNSNTKMFSEWAEHFALPRIDELKEKKVLMYCTGGVRCEKASAFLRSKGVADVSQLSGGIHRYLEKYGSKGHFVGSNFVFDSRGLQRPEGAAVIAKCYSCNAPEETMSSDRACAVCRDSIIICDGCRKNKLGVYFCSVHMDLAGKYSPFLETRTMSELEAEKAALEALVAPGGKYSTKSQRTRRKTLRKQIGRITNRMQQLESNTATVSQDPTMRARCRSCGKPSASLCKLLGVSTEGVQDLCDAHCWGFFQHKRRSEGYVDIYETQRKRAKADEKTESS